MKDHASAGKANGKSADSPLQLSPPAGNEAMALAPPAYGIEFVDRGLVAGAFPADGIVPGAIHNGLGLRTKLRVNEPGDAHEQEADRVAEQVMRMPQPQVAPQSRSPPPLRLSGYAANASAPRGASSSLVQDALNSSGQPLDAATRAFMEPRFGHDFSKVRVHSDAAAQRSAQPFGAKAYAVGDDIVFGANQFAPATTEGRQLLAHELAHVTQHSGNLQRKPEAKGGMRIPVQPTEDDSPYWFSGTLFYYHIRNDIQWHFNPFIWGSFDIVVHRDEEKRKKYSASQIAGASAGVLADGIGLPLKGGGTELAKHIATQIDEYGLIDSEFFLIHVPFDLIKRQFDEKAFDAYWADVKETYTAEERQWLLIACADFGSGKGSSKGDREGSKWAKATKREIDALLSKARKETPPQKDLPDRVVLWHNERDNNWYFNVWTSLATTGAEKQGQAVKLVPGESAEKLLARLREATLEGLQKVEDKERREIARQLAPAWAIELERKLRQRLDELRAKEKDARDLPDGMVLVPDDKVYLQIWVQRGDKKVQRNTGAVPLVPAATVDQLVPYVRNLTAILRQYRADPARRGTPAARGRGDQPRSEPGARGVPLGAVSARHALGQHLGDRREERVPHAARLRGGLRRRRAEEPVHSLEALLAADPLLLGGILHTCGRAAAAGAE